MIREATTLDETPVYIPLGDEDVFGVLTAPTSEATGVCVVLAFGGIFNLSVGRNRITVRLARRLAGRGFHVLRLEMHGVGESSGAHTEMELAAPWITDLQAALSWLEERGIRRIVLVGECFGARTCAAAAPRVTDLLGVALLSPPVTDHGHADLKEVHMGNLPTSQFALRAVRGSILRGLLDRSRRQRYARILRQKLLSIVRRRSGFEPEESRLFPGWIAALASRGVPTLLAFGNDEYARLYERATRGSLGRIVANAGAALRVHRFDLPAHGFPNLAVQDQAIELIEGWVDGLVTPVGR